MEVGDGNPESEWASARNRPGTQDDRHAAREVEGEVKRAIEYIDSNIVPGARRDGENLLRRLSEELNHWLIVSMTNSKPVDLRLFSRHRTAAATAPKTKRVLHAASSYKIVIFA
jgi:hypothetical protein